MKQSTFTEKQIIGVLEEQEAGATIADVCCKHKGSEATFCVEVWTCPDRRHFSSWWMSDKRRLSVVTGP